MRAILGRFLPAGLISLLPFNEELQVSREEDNSWAVGIVKLAVT
jgi:hypothetical protein